MIGLRRALVVLGVLGVALAGVAVALAFESDHIEDAVAAVVVSVVLMLSYIGVGLYAWWRRPTNRVGALMTAVGFATFLSALQLSNSSLLFTIGLVIGGGFFFAVGVHMLLAFPTGRIESKLERRLVAVGYTFAIGIPLGVVATSPEGYIDHPEDHPDNAFLIVDDQSVGDVIEMVGGLLGVGLVVAVAYVLVRRTLSAGPRERRAMAPMLWLATLMLVLLCLSFMLDVPGDVGNDAENAVDLLSLLAFAALPYAFLAGLARTRAWRAGAIGEVLEALGDASGRGRLRDALRDALGDPSLRIAYWLPDRREYVDAEGHVMELPARGVTDVEREGVCVGALVHDPALGEDDPGLVRAVASGAALALENERLEAELRARVEELQRSRALLVDAALSERRRLERDLHDGAQQRLVALSLQLGMVAAQLEKRPEAARELLDGAREEARLALEDLRELARGIHPAVLTDRGLPAALESLADRAPLPVEVAEVPEERLPGAVEAAAYFVVAESLTNVAKYAQATHASVRVGRENGFALIEVRDDGVGGADPESGTGLRGLADRLAALDGRLEVDSEAGRGTVVRARVPCA